MPLTLKPTSTRVSAVNRSDPTSRNRYVTSFAFDFTNEPLSLQTVGGQSFQGASYRLNMQQLTGNAQSGPIKALQITCEFQAGIDDGGDLLNDSDLFIFVPATNQVIRLGQQFVAGLTSGTLADAFETTCVVSAIVPVSSFAPTVIEFIKGTTSGGTATFGNLTVSAFDFKQQPYYAAGFSSL
jgi:hypothetical protein